jgi:hypothetical protein
MDIDETLKAMLSVSGALADMADKEAPNWATVPGDVALRAFAEAIRRTNVRAEDVRTLVQ